ncbi:MAG: 7-carboxy-7-deazaguanine synthase QueE [Gammaproteobacteria bacterium RIFCSPHIGHO2_12_FULL_37_34]|nr:MAG: 7-carboxy-7-deazaguanine synthase QueE [Gammaproteobacteria bacterium RIFCSPHIGHO2_12_FULL_37_34]
MNILKLRVTEIFFSLQGETNTAGLPTVFIRLTGCPLRCQYCDTAYAFHGGKWYELDAIFAEIKQYRTRYITVTGGEPLAQQACVVLLKRLCDEGYTVSLETSGAMDVSLVDSRVVKVIDIKTPGSGEVEKNDWDNIDQLLPHDQIKFVICHREDYDWAKQILATYQLNLRSQVLFSPSYQQISATELADWIVKDQLSVRLQIQLHKLLWGEVRGK